MILFQACDIAAGSVNGGGWTAVAVKSRLESGARRLRGRGARAMPVGFGLTGLEVDARRRAAARGEGAEQAAGASISSLEAYMLGELARHSDAAGAAGPLRRRQISSSWTSSRPTAAASRRASSATPAELIAALHATPRHWFGYERDTLIGPLPQPNPKSDRWMPFFRDQRLLAMARRRRGRARCRRAPRPHRELGGAARRLSRPSRAHPSLLHGDLWTGNVLVRRGRIAGFVDPAIYCGHPRDRARLHHPVRDVRQRLLRDL